MSRRMYRRYGYQRTAQFGRFRNSTRKRIGNSHGDERERGVGGAKGLFCIYIYVYFKGFAGKFTWVEGYLDIH